MDSILYAPIFANRHIALATQITFPYLPMASLLALRATCRDSHVLATKELRRSLLTLLAKFFPNPRLFLRSLTTHRALIVGEAALAHILHDQSFCNSTLEIAVPNVTFDRFILSFNDLLPYGSHVAANIVKPAPPTFAAVRHITRIAEFHLTSGLSIQVYCSFTPSACDVVCGAWTTALMNFVTQSTLGCAYPRLTLNHSGFLCDGRMESMRWLDHSAQHNLESKAFHLSTYSPEWPSISGGPYGSPSLIAEGCGRRLHVCPFQGRFFGDPGSLIIFYDGFTVDLETLRDLSIAPYGVMSAWRVPTKDDCQGGCSEDDAVLPAFVISIMFQFAEHRPTVTYQLPSSTTTRALLPSHTRPAIPTRRAST